MGPDEKLFSSMWCRKKLSLLIIAERKVGFGLRAVSVKLGNRSRDPDPCTDHMDADNWHLHIHTILALGFFYLLFSSVHIILILWAARYVD
jgi:hypothetical protein